MKKIIFSVSALVFGISAMAFTYKNLTTEITSQQEIKYIPVETKSFNAGSVKTVDAKTINGDVKIFGDARGNATVVVSAYGQKAEKLSAQVLQALINKYWDISIEESGNGKLTVVQKTKVRNVPNEAQINFLFEIHTSSSVSAEASSVSGDVSVKDINSANTSSTSGDVTLYNVAGSVNATSVSGDITGLKIGTIQNINSTSGDIILDIQSLNHDAKVNSVSGDVKLKLGANTKATLSATTISGDMKADGFNNITHSDKNLNGSLNGGGSALDVSTVSGDVNISKI